MQCTRHHVWHPQKNRCQLENFRTVGASSSSSAMGSSVQMWAMRDARNWLTSLTARACNRAPANPSYNAHIRFFAT